VLQPWDETLGRFAELGVIAVPTLYRGPYRANLFEDLARSLDLETHEGFVARVASGFAESKIPRRMGKFARAGHVQSETHWMNAEPLPNQLSKT